MPSYNSTQFQPPAPVAFVTLRIRNSALSASHALMFIDTGADATLLPRAAVNDLGPDVPVGRTYALTGFDGSESVTSSVIVQLFVEGYGIEGEFPLIDNPIGYLGRDVLNNVVLLLDGPQSMWSIQLPAKGEEPEH